MSSWLRNGLHRLLGGSPTPAVLRAHLDADELVLAVAETTEGQLAASSYGLWVLGSDEPRRIDWFMISKATWGDDVLTVTESERRGQAGDAVLLRDRPPVRFRIREPAKLPQAVHAKVTGSISSSEHRELGGGGARFVHRKVPGVGMQLQVRADPGTDEQVVAETAAQVARRLQRGS